MSKKEEKEYEEYESLKNSKLKQQKLPGWRPVPSMARTVTVFITLGVIFAGLGVLILLFSNQIVEIKERYDDDKNCINTNKCNIIINITKKMEKNISIYYELDGFYQNHRRYISSKSESQLKGENITLKEMIDSKDCYPLVTNEDMEVGEAIDTDKTKLDPKDLAIPCGLMAKNFFNDSFKIYKENGEKIIIDEKNIARKSDRDKYKKNFNLSKQWISLTDEHFMVWMRPSPFTNFQKLWGRINEDLEADTKINVEINNNYPVKHFNGRKYIVLRTINYFGGKNFTLAIAYMGFGGFSIILGIIFLISFKAKAKKEK